MYEVGFDVNIGSTFQLLQGETFDKTTTTKDEVQLDIKANRLWITPLHAILDDAAFKTRTAFNDGHGSFFFLYSSIRYHGPWSSICRHVMLGGENTHTWSATKGGNPIPATMLEDLKQQSNDQQPNHISHFPSRRTETKQRKKQHNPV